MRSICESLAGKQPLYSLENWQTALANAFLLASKGRCDDGFEKACKSLYDELISLVGDSNQVEAIQGMFLRINLTFERSAEAIAAQRA